MVDASFLNRVLQRAVNFRSAKSGNVAVIFAFSLVPLLLFVGGAIDYTRANFSRTAMQEALDSATLMLSKDVKGLSQSAIQAKGEAYFKALYNDPYAQDVSVTVAYTEVPGGGSQIVMDGSAALPTELMYLAGYQKLPFSASSTVVWGSTKMRVAMSLDNTGSMAQSGKLGAMQEAAKGLIDTLSKTSQNSGDVLISIIPFSKDVNADPTNYGKSWIDWSLWEAAPTIVATKQPSNWSQVGPGSSCPFNNSDYGFGCSPSPASGSTTKTIPSTGDYAGMICPSVDSGRYNSSRTSVYYNGCYTSDPNIISQGNGASCGNRSNCTCSGSGSNKKCMQGYTHTWRKSGTTAAPAHSTWNGCVTDRDQDYDTKSNPPTTSDTLFYAEQYSSCTLPVMAMSEKWDALKGQIDDMKAVGNTNQGIGMAWGWLSLLQQDPLPALKEDANYKYDRVVILLSDGDNTQNRYSTNAKTIDGRQKLLCDNAKAAGIEIYTIQVNTDGTATSDVMSYCASDTKTEHFFSVKDKGGIADAFAQIGASLTKLRVAR
jgi:Putative Flp pilus-assembly TadE/G-like/von Willebrand factor type A domain